MTCIYVRLYISLSVSLGHFRCLCPCRSLYLLSPSFILVICSHLHTLFSSPSSPSSSSSHSNFPHFPSRLLPLSLTSSISSSFYLLLHLLLLLILHSACFFHPLLHILLLLIRHSTFPLLLPSIFLFFFSLSFFFSSTFFFISFLFTSSFYSFLFSFDPHLFLTPYSFNPSLIRLILLHLPSTHPPSFPPSAALDFSSLSIPTHLSHRPCLQQAPIIVAEASIRWNTTPK